MAADRHTISLRQATEQVGRNTLGAVAQIGYAASLFFQGMYWMLWGARRGQPVGSRAVISEMMKVGVQAVPIVAVLSFSVGVMIALQGIYTLRDFGAETRVVDAIALSISREFGALITAFLVAGRSGSALAAQLGTMKISQEIDALQVMGINPIRYLVSPALLAMLVMLPCLTILADFMGMFGGSLLCYLLINMDIGVYAERSFAALEMYDIAQGLIKSGVFAVLITLVGVINGFGVQGGAAGVGSATTRSVVVAISCIIIADMIFTYFLSR